MKYFIFALIVPIFNFSNPVDFHLEFSSAKSYAEARAGYLSFHKARQHIMYDELEIDPNYKFNTNYLHGYVNGSLDSYKDMLHVLDQF